MEGRELLVNSFDKETKKGGEKQEGRRIGRKGKKGGEEYKEMSKS